MWAEKFVFPNALGHNNISRYKKFWWPSGPFSMDLLEIISKLEVPPRKLKLPGLTAGHLIYLYVYSFLEHF